MACPLIPSKLLEDKLKIGIILTLAIGFAPIVEAQPKESSVKVPSKPLSEVEKKHV